MAQAAGVFSSLRDTEQQEWRGQCGAAQRFPVSCSVGCAELSGQQLGVRLKCLLRLLLLLGSLLVTHSLDQCPCPVKG